MKKVLSLLVVLGMLFVASNAFARGWNPNVTVQGFAEAHTNYYINTNDFNFAGGGSYGAGDYKATGYLGAIGNADANSTTRGWVGDGQNWRGAAAYTKSDSEAFGGTLGVVNTGVEGGGLAEAGTRMAPQGNGGSTYAMGAYSYQNDNASCLLGYSQGNGGAIAGGYVVRNNIGNGITSHAVSGSLAYSSGGGNLPQ